MLRRLVFILFVDSLSFPLASPMLTPASQLTFVQSAVIAARNAFAAAEAKKADERKKKEGKVTVDDSRGSSLLGSPAGAEKRASRGQTSGLGCVDESRSRLLLGECN